MEVWKEYSCQKYASLIAHSTMVPVSIPQPISTKQSIGLNGTRIKDVQLGYVNVYEVDDAKLKEAKVLWFDKPTENWVDFVYSNRNDKSFCHNYDFVYGPVANDRVYAAFALYESGILDKQELIRELKTYKLADQLLFHTDKALALLHYIEAIRIDL